MPVELRIVMTDEGQVQVNGPLQNKIMCYGLLMTAMDAIRDTHDANRRLVQPVSLVPPTIPGFPSNN